MAAEQQKDDTGTFLTNCFTPRRIAAIGVMQYVGGAYSAAKAIELWNAGRLKEVPIRGATALLFFAAGRFAVSLAREM